MIFISFPIISIANEKKHIGNWVGFDPEEKYEVIFIINDKSITIKTEEGFSTTIKYSIPKNSCQPSVVLFFLSDGIFVFKIIS